MKKKEKRTVRRKVVCVWGRYDGKSDFVLEPADERDKDSFWIEGEEQ